MFLNHLDRQTKLNYSMLIAALWIYFREQIHYQGLPRKSIISVLLVVSWIYLHDQEPLMLPLGLAALYTYGEYQKNKS